MDTSLDIITLYNIDNQDFEVIYDNKSYGIIPSGQAKRFPRFLATLAAKHLTDQILNKKDIATNNVEERAKVMREIVIGEEKYQQPRPKTETERLQERVHEMNADTDLERILAEKREQAQQPETPPVNPENTSNEVSEPEQQPEPAQETQRGEGSQPKEAEGQAMEENKEEEKQETIQHNGEPTRQQLYDYAKNVLGMDMNDSKTLAILENQAIPELKETLGYDPQAA